MCYFVCLILFSPPKRYDGKLCFFSTTTTSISDPSFDPKLDRVQKKKVLEVGPENINIAVPKLASPRK